MIVRKIVFSFAILILSLIAFSNVLDFVPADSGFFLYLENNSQNYEKLKEVPLFNFLLQSMGLEFMISMNIQQLGSSSEIEDPMEVMKLLSKDMVIFSNFSYDELIESMDTTNPENMKNMEELLSKYPIGVVLGEFEDAQKLVDLMLKLFQISAEKSDEVYNIQGVYLKVHGKYVLVATAKDLIDKMEKTYSGSEKLVNKYPNMISKLLAEEAWGRLFIKPPDFEKISKVYEEEFGKSFPVKMKKAEAYGYLKLKDGKLFGILETKSEYEGEPPFELPEKPKGIEVIEGKIKFPGQIFALWNVEDFYDPMKEYYKDVLEQIPEVKEKMTEEEIKTVEKILDAFNGKFHFELNVGQSSTDTYFNFSVGLKSGSKGGIEELMKNEEKVGLDTYKLDDTYIAVKDEEIIVTNLPPDDYKSKVEKAGKLIDDPMYSSLPKKDGTLIRIYVNLKEILEKFAGMGSESYLLLDVIYVSDKESKVVLTIK